MAATCVHVLVREPVTGMYRQFELARKRRPTLQSVELVHAIGAAGVRIFAGVQLDRVRPQVQSSLDRLRCGIDEE